MEPVSPKHETDPTKNTKSIWPTHEIRLAETRNQSSSKIDHVSLKNETVFTKT